MSAEQNLELLHGMVVALNAQDIEEHDKYWSKDMIWHGPASFGDIHGLQAFKDDVLKPFYAAFPGFHGTIDIEVVQGDWIAEFLIGYSEGD